jgi:folate-dependent phosphoribosylglycinamide formyltransferase PurN
MKNWVTFFTQTGSEIYQLIKETGFVPKKIITNKKKSLFGKVNPYLLDEYGYLIYSISPNPSIEDYFTALKDVTEKDIVTLHGYLRIIPDTICDKFTIFNGHPGLITKYEVLKGKDPQKRAFDLGLKQTGSVIHHVTSELDGGTIVASRNVSIREMSLEDVYDTLHKNSVSLWKQFLKENLK